MGGPSGGPNAKALAARLGPTYGNQGPRAPESGCHGDFRPHLLGEGGGLLLLRQQRFDEAFDLSCHTVFLECFPDSIPGCAEVSRRR